LIAGLVAAGVSRALPVLSNAPWIELFLKAVVFLVVSVSGLIIARQVGKADVAEIRALITRVDSVSDVVAAQGDTR
jgi:hypothetical protein